VLQVLRDLRKTNRAPGSSTCCFAKAHQRPAHAHDLGLITRKEIIAILSAEQSRQSRRRNFRAIVEFQHLDLEQKYTRQSQCCPAAQDQIEEVLLQMRKRDLKEQTELRGLRLSHLPEKAMPVCQGLRNRACCLLTSSKSLRTLHEICRNRTSNLSRAALWLQTERLASMANFPRVAHEINNPLGTVLIYAT